MRGTYLLDVLIMSKIQGDNGQYYSKNDKFNHGIGLSNIKEVIEHYQGDIRYTVEKDMVSAEIILFHVVKC